MPRKPLLKPILTFTFLLFLLTLYSFHTTIFAFDSPICSGNSNFNQQKPAKIYMYDLPQRFTYGVIESYAAARGGDALLKYPGHQHSAEWYLFKSLNENRVDLPLTRVLDPENADLFYVPFFSSLSLVANPIRPTDSKAGGLVYSDEQTQEALIEWLDLQVYWKRNNGWDHVFICQDPNALNKVIDRVKNGILLVSDFGRLGRDQASLVKDVILPYSHRINTYKGDV